MSPSLHTRVLLVDETINKYEVRSTKVPRACLRVPLLNIPSSPSDDALSSHVSSSAAAQGVKKYRYVTGEMPTKLLYTIAGRYPPAPSLLPRAFRPAAIIYNTQPSWAVRLDTTGKFIGAIGSHSADGLAAPFRDKLYKIRVTHIYNRHYHMAPYIHSRRGPSSSALKKTTQERKNKSSSTKNEVIQQQQ